MQDAFAKLGSWRRLEELVAAELAALLGVELSVIPDRSSVVTAAELPLVCPAYQVELAIRIGVDAVGRQAFQDFVLGGESSSEALADALRELANTVGGALKRAALEEGVELTIGLPRDVDPIERDAGRSWSVTGNGLEIGCIAYRSSSAPARVSGRDLREGMVLSHDVLGAGGAVLAAAGTYLTKTMAERLQALVGDHRIEVTDLTMAG